MDQPSTSTAMEVDEQIEQEKIGKEATQLIKRIIRNILLDEDKTTKKPPLDDPLGRAARYTGMNKCNIETIYTMTNNMKVENVEINRTLIHEKLMNMYLEEKYIPTISQLYVSLQTQLPVFVSRDYFIKILIKMGYMFYKFPIKKSLYVMEKKTVTFERYKYLKSIKQYRKDNVPIVYVGVASFYVHKNLFNLERTLRTDPRMICRHFLFTVTGEAVENIKVIPSANYKDLKNAVKNWLIEIITLQQLPPGSVLILEDSQIFCDLLTDIPDWKSLKPDMMEWLEEHNIPCDDDMSKAELLQLIEFTTDTKQNTYVIEALCKMYNYSFLRLPQCINGLSIVAGCIQGINLEHEALEDWETCLTMLENYSSLDLGYFVHVMEIEEDRQFEEDIKLDNSLDELVRKMKMTKISVAENDDDIVLPVFYDSD